MKYLYFYLLYKMRLFGTVKQEVVHWRSLQTSFGLLACPVDLQGLLQGAETGRLIGWRFWGKKDSVICRTNMKQCHHLIREKTSLGFNTAPLLRRLLFHSWLFAGLLLYLSARFCKVLI